MNNHDFELPKKALYEQNYKSETFSHLVSWMWTQSFDTSVCFGKAVEMFSLWCRQIDIPMVSMRFTKNQHLRKIEKLRKI